MAFRASTLTTGAASTTLTCTRPTTVAGDKLIAFASNGDPAGTLTMTGWTKLDQTAISGPDGQAIALFYIDSATGSDPMVLTGTSVEQMCCVIASFSGRASGAPSFVVTTPNTTANASPISVTITGVTASANDDLAVSVALDPTINTIGYSQTTTPAALTRRNDFPAANNWAPLALSTADAVSAGATGNFAFVATGAGGSAGWSGYTVRMAAVPPNQGGGIPTIQLTKPFDLQRQLGNQRASCWPAELKISRWF